MIVILLALILGFSPEKVLAKSPVTTFSLANTPVAPSLCLVYKPIQIILPEQTVTGVSCHEDQYEILKDFGYSQEIYEVVNDKQVDGKRVLTVVLVTRKRSLEWTKIKHPVVVTYVKNLPHGKKVYDKGGRNGLQGRVIEEIIFPDGKKKSRTIEKWVEKEPVTEYSRIGTKYDLKEKEIDGKKIYYWRTLTVLATSYDHTCYGCNKTTATGAYLTKGIVAVDPKVIPLHTSMYIPGYGFGKAEDTGGKIKGNRIDLAYDDIRYGDWSRRWVTIYIID